MKKYFFISVLFLFTLTSCERTHIVVGSQLSHPVYEKPVSPGGNYIWIEGDWVVENNNYVWHEGHWVKARRHRIWEPGHWENTTNGWYWQKGRWN